MGTTATREDRTGGIIEIGSDTDSTEKSRRQQWKFKT
jgi:hypothetical protein